MAFAPVPYHILETFRWRFACILTKEIKELAVTSASTPVDFRNILRLRLSESGLAAPDVTTMTDLRPVVSSL